MKIKRLVIENFKSIERIELVEPNPFTVFVGPNGSGKSNIFEALEFFNLSAKTSRGTVEGLFGGPENFLNRRSKTNAIQVDYQLTNSHSIRLMQRESSSNKQEYTIGGTSWSDKDVSNEFRQLVADFSRLFVGNDKLVKLPFNDNLRLSLSAKNLEPVLKRILTNEILRNEIFEWLELFVPEFKSVLIDDRNELHWFEQYSPEYFTKNLISDGTFNILAMLTAVYQSDDKPQFLCIEEPENGLHPQVAAELVDFFRHMCQERGHFIWLNTHSQSIMARLKPEEMVIVDKKEGATRVKQIPKERYENWRMDEALLMNAFGGGLPW